MGPNSGVTEQNQKQLSRFRRGEKIKRTNLGKKSIEEKRNGQMDGHGDQKKWCLMVPDSTCWEEGQKLKLVNYQDNQQNLEVTQYFKVDYKLYQN